jgi:hypothetical protein
MKVDRVRALAPDGVDAALDIAGSGVIPQLIELTGDPSKVLSTADFNAPEYAFGIPVDRAFPLEQAAQAQEASAAGHVKGRLVITIP